MAEDPVADPVPKLRAAIEKKHGTRPAWVKTVPVREKGDTPEAVWEVNVEVFALEGGATPYCYAWFQPFESAERLEPVVVLASDDIQRPDDAVRAALAGHLDDKADESDA